MNNSYTMIVQFYILRNNFEMFWKWTMKFSPYSHMINWVIILITTFENEHIQGLVFGIFSRKNPPILDVCRMWARRIFLVVIWRRRRGFRCLFVYLFGDLENLGEDDDKGRSHKKTGTGGNFSLVAAPPGPPGCFILCFLVNIWKF